MWCCRSRVNVLNVSGKRCVHSSKVCLPAVRGISMATDYCIARRSALYGVLSCTVVRDGRGGGGMYGTAGQAGGGQRFAILNVVGISVESAVNSAGAIGARSELLQTIFTLSPALRRLSSAVGNTFHIGLDVRRCRKQLLPCCLRRRHGNR